MTRCQPVSRRSGVMASETSSNRSAQMPVVSVMSSIGFALSRSVSALKTEPEERRERDDEDGGFDEAITSSSFQLSAVSCQLSCRVELAE